MRSRLEPRFLFSFCLVVGRRLACQLYKTATGAVALQTERGCLRSKRQLGSVSEKALLQDQLSKGMRAGRPRVQQERCEGVPEISEQPAILEVKMDIGNIAVTWCPTLGDSWNDCAQDFAALHLRRLFLLLFRFGMKRASRLRRIVFCCHRRERAMVRDRNPGTDRNRNARATHTRFHIQCWLWSARTRPRFSKSRRVGITALQIVPAPRGLKHFLPLR